MIESTTDYSIFKKHPNNRELVESNLKKIQGSIEAKNLLSIRPILVNKKMQVIDGQHRLEVAKRMHIEIHYQIEEHLNHEDIHFINIQKAWALEDYFNYFLSLGKEEYIKMDRFIKEQCIPFKHALLYLSLSGGSSNARVRAGTFTFPTMKNVEKAIFKKQFIDKIISLLSENKMGYTKFVESKKFQEALLFVLNNEDVDPSELLRKIELNLSKIFPCSRKEEYFIIFKNIYNFKRKEPVDFTTRFVDKIED